MAGTVIITGANSPLATPAVEHLLTNYPNHAVILTVRNASSTDGNTKMLRDTVARFSNAETSIRELDLANLSVVHDFTSTTRW